ncbi:TPA: hydrogenase expression/formation protein [Candidatus Poribacteria bacterium]|nr:hydrogenase expression/formation protein [Candidatus Poribacteria bacterium]
MMHDMEDSLPVGKLKVDFLYSLIAQAEIIDPRVVIGPQIGEDATVIDFGDKYLVAKTDPITFATDEIGWYLVCVNSNDIATMGAVPKWLLLTVLLPEHKTTESLVQQIFEQILKACREFNITLCGGHTEITYGLDRPIVIGQMLGEVSKDKLVTSSGARIGDDILLSKGIAIEATSIIAREKEAELKERYSGEFIDKAKKFLKNPGISVLKEALITTEVGGVHAMHDPTEGGIANAVNELAICADVGAIIFEERIPIFSETRKLCEDFGLEPLGAISSGALLIVADPSFSSKIIFAIQQKGISCTNIGAILPREEGVSIESKSKRRPLPMFDSDEITKIF